MKEEDRIKMSFGFAADVSKQLIALSTAIITLCVALADKLFSSQAIKSNSIWLLIALILFVLSIFLGLLCLMAITGTLGKPEADASISEKEERTEDSIASDSIQDVEPKPGGRNNGTIYQSNIRGLMITQIFIFLGGLILSIIFLCVAASSHPVELDTQNVSASDRSTIRVERTSNYAILDSVIVDTIKVYRDGIEIKNYN